MKRTALTRADLILILLLALLGGAFLLYRGRSTSGLTVRIYSENVLLTELPMDQDAVYTVTTDKGTNTVNISGGTVFVTDADCPDKTCELQGAVSKPGATIICLPHGLIVEVSDDE